MDELQVQLKTDLPLHDKQIRVEKIVKNAIVNGSFIASDHRAAVWRLLLDVPDSQDDEEDQSAIDTVVQDLPKQRVIKVDAERTRCEIPYFKQDGQIERIQRLLTYYCKAGYACQGLPLSGRSLSAVSYRQGLNEILAVFMYIAFKSGDVRDGKVMAMFSKFVARYAPRIYASNDDEFISLQCSFRLFRLLLLYHDPELCKLLDQYDVAPELYATPWFLTLFSRGTDMETVLPLWDFLICACRTPGPAVFHCVAAAFLMRNRDAIFAATAEGADPSELPLTISRLTLTGVSDVHGIIDMASYLLVNTPLFFRKQIHNVCYSGGARLQASIFSPKAEPVPISATLLARLEKRISVKISVEEILRGAGSRLSCSSGSEASFDSAADVSLADIDHSTARSILTAPDALFRLPPRYFLIDCRPTTQFERGGHLPTAFHFDPRLLDEPEELEEKMKVFRDLRGIHIAVMGCGDVAQWYHAPMIPAALKQDAAQGSDTRSSNNPHEDLFDAAGDASLLADQEDLAVRAGLDPLLGEEEADYSRSDVTRSLILYFLQKGFARVCEVEGGYAALHQHQAYSLQSVLVGHDPAYCEVCNAHPLEGSEDGSKAASSRSSRSGSGFVSAPSRSSTSSPVPVSPEQPSVRKRIEALAAWYSRTGYDLSEPMAPAYTVHEHEDEVEIVLFGGDGGAIVPATKLSTKAPPRAAPTRASRPSSGPPSIIADYDADGLPILTEDALLESQCDDIERRSGRFVGRVRARTKAPSELSGRLPAHSVAADGVVNIDEILAAKAVAAAKSAAKLGKNLLHTVLTAPAASNSSPPREGLPAAKQRALSSTSNDVKITTHTSRFLDVLRMKERAEGGGDTA